MTLLDSALIAHGRTVFERSIQAASLDHALWFHRPFRADDWLLYAQDSAEHLRRARLLARPDLRARRHPRRLGGAGRPDPPARRPRLGGPPGEVARRRPCCLNSEHTADVRPRASGTSSRQPPSVPRHSAEKVGGTRCRADWSRKLARPLIDAPGSHGGACRRSTRTMSPAWPSREPITGAQIHEDRHGHHQAVQARGGARRADLASACTA